jgi:hypothetical protein
VLQKGEPAASWVTLVVRAPETPSAHSWPCNQALAIARRFPNDSRASDLCFTCNLGLAHIGTRATARARSPRAPSTPRARSHDRRVRWFLLSDATRRSPAARHDQVDRIQELAAQDQPRHGHGAGAALSRPGLAPSHGLGPPFLCTVDRCSVVCSDFFEVLAHVLWCDTPDPLRK